MSTVGLAAIADVTGRASAVPRGRVAIGAVSTVMLFAVDNLAVAVAFTAAYLIRFGTADSADPAMPFEHYLRVGVGIGVASSVLLVLQGLGDLERRRSWPTRLRAITSSVSTGAILALIALFDQDQRLSRAWLAIGWSLSIVLLSSWRSLAPTIDLALRRSFAWRPRAVVVGANDVGRDVARELERTFEVLGYVDNGTDLVEGLDRPMLGPIADLEAIVRAGAVDEVVIALPPDRREQIDRIVARGFGRQVDVKLIRELDGSLPSRVEVGRFGSRPYIGFAPVARVTWIKRASDIALAAITLAVAVPLFVGIAAAIRLESPGPVFYRQRRLGKNGFAFDMLKFRSMCVDADAKIQHLMEHNEATGPLFKMRRDPRVTNVGRILRRGSLDELPQLLNVLRGEMSLVGPRPPLPAEVAKYEDWQLARLRALPGMTGLWQVSGRSEVPFNDMVRLDLHYGRNWSLGLDLEILLRTIPAVLANRGAY